MSLIFGAYIFYTYAKAHRSLSNRWLYVRRSLEADKNDTCSGKAALIKLEYSNFYFIRDNNDTLYWTEFEFDELDIVDRHWPLFGNEKLEPKQEFIKSVRIGEYTHSY